MKLLATLAMLLALTGCAGFNADPLVDVANNALDEPTIKSGMTSRDAAYMAAYKAYVKEQSRDKPIVVIEGTGEEIKLSGVKSIKVYAQGNSDTVAAPEKEKPIVSQILDSVSRIAERVLLPFYIVKESNQTQRDASTKALESERIRSGERERVTSQAIEASSKPPLVVHVPSSVVE